MEEENAIDLLQRYRRDRRVLLDFILSGSLIKKVVIPPGAVMLDDVDLDQVSVDYVLNCAKKSEMLELSEAIREYHDHTGLPQMSDTGSVGEFYLVTDPESSGSPPKRPPPPVPISAVPPIAVSTPPSSSKSLPLTLLQSAPIHLLAIHLQNPLSPRFNSPHNNPTSLISLHILFRSSNTVHYRFCSQYFRRSQLLEDHTHESR